MYFRDYYDALGSIHALVEPLTYVEIGVRAGQSLCLAREDTHCLGVDPHITIDRPLPPQTKLFPLTSDSFFARFDVRQELGDRLIDLAFIDGMYLFENALRDFIALEHACHRDSTILVHDCYPIDAVTSSRERRTAVWSGDVWKLITCLVKYRPELCINTVDVGPTGLAIIRGLNPDSLALSENVTELCAEFVDLNYETIAATKAESLCRVSGSWSAVAQAVNWKPSRSVIHRAIEKAHRILPKTVSSHVPAIWRQRLLPRRLSKAVRPRCLGVLLCYNDADILPDVIEYLLGQQHELLVVDHGSDDATPSVLDQYASYFRQRLYLPRAFDFYQLYPWMSQFIMKNFINHYDWISWPDQDEILEGPSRAKNYVDWVREVWESPYSWVQFDNYNFWYTEADDVEISRPSERLRHYALFPDCAPRIRAWKAQSTNIREFNHNRPLGNVFPSRFKIRHYPMRSQSQMRRRLKSDRAGLQRGIQNFHYNNMLKNQSRLFITSSELHRDDGFGELNEEVIFDWRHIYGRPPSDPDVAPS